MRLAVLAVVAVGATNLLPAADLPPAVPFAPPPATLLSTLAPAPGPNPIADNPGDSLQVPGHTSQTGSPSQGGAVPLPPPPQVPSGPPPTSSGPPPPPPTGAPVPPIDDFGAAAAIANANDPDLSNLPGWELIDPFGVQLEALENQPLKGGGALSAIAQACADYGIDTRACVANALHEGAGGGMGDRGEAYGPFQDHLTEFAGRPFYGKGANNAVVNAWAWTENGIRYSVRQMATGKPSAKGLTGHAAVYAIVYGYEKPGDERGAYTVRAAEYDRLVRLGSGWAADAAAKMHGPIGGGGVDTGPLAPPPATSYTPAGVVANWRGLVDVFKVAVPTQHARVASLASSLVEVMR